MEQDMADGDASYIGSIDLESLSPKEWEALKRRIIRRAHAERAQAIGAMFCWLPGRLHQPR
ncbi:hypothetical protein AC629_22350 [Bradyrhizobium sp. NAS80.1]|nr:hypothetical protein AC629_22350 [Bradyrhizobium sp. NAS80.1]